MIAGRFAVGLTGLFVAFRRPSALRSHEGRPVLASKVLLHVRVDLLDRDTLLLE